MSPRVSAVRTHCRVHGHAYRVSPTDTDTMSCIGMLYLEKGEPQKAFEFFGKALVHNPKDVDVSVLVCVVWVCVCVCGCVHLIPIRSRRFSFLLLFLHKNTTTKVDRKRNVRMCGCKCSRSISIAHAVRAMWRGGAAMPCRRFSQQDP